MYQLLWYLLHGSPPVETKVEFPSFLSEPCILAIATVTTEGLMEEEEGNPKKSTIVGINWPGSKSKSSPDPPQGITISTFLTCDITILYTHTAVRLGCSYIYSVVL